EQCAIIDPTGRWGSQAHPQADSSNAINGSLEEPVILCMQFLLVRFLTALVSIGCAASVGQVQEERRTVVTPLPNEEILSPCEYRMILPGTVPIKAIWTIEIAAKHARPPHHRSASRAC